MDRTIFGWFFVFAPFISVVFHVAYAETELQCHPYLTLNVTGEYSNGLLRAHGYEFPDGYYHRLNKTHFSVCICKATSCLRKCCLPGQVFYNWTCIDWKESIINPPVYDSNLNLIHNYDYRKFVRVYGNTCSHGWYIMEPNLGKEDIHYLLENGNLFTPYHEMKNTHQAESFCYENIIQNLDQDPSASALKAVVCIPGDEAEVSVFIRIGLIISTPFLLATFIVYSMPELRNLHGKNLMSYIGSLFIAYVSLIIVQTANFWLSADVCIGMGYTIQFTFLAAFFWLNVMCFDIWWAFSGFSIFKGDKRTRDLKKYLMYSAYAWGCPAVITVVTVILQFVPGIPDSIVKPDIGIASCFFSSRTTNLAYFYGPLSFLLLFDLIFFIMTAVKIIMVKKETVEVFRGKDSKRKKEASKQRYILYLKLFLIMGVNWIMEVISWAVKGPAWAWYFTDFVNALQGIVIFTIFVLKSRIKTVISNRFSSQTLKSVMKWDTTNFAPRLRETTQNGVNPAFNNES